MIDAALITPTGRLTDGPYDVAACLYCVQRGLWTACGYDKDRQAVVLDWGGVPRKPSKGFCNFRSTDNGGMGDGIPVPNHIRPEYKYDMLALINSDYVSVVNGTKWQDRCERGTSFTDEQRSKIDRWRSEGMPAIWIESKLKTGNTNGVRYLASFVACRTVQTNEGRRMLQEAYREGYSEMQIAEGCGLSRRLVNWVIHEWGK